MKTQSLIILDISALPTGLKNLGDEWHLASAKSDLESKSWDYFLTRKGDYKIGERVTIHFDDAAHGDPYLKDLAPRAPAPIPV